MPKGSKVHRVYSAMRRDGAAKGKAARVAQATTGQSLKTGKRPERAPRRKRGGNRG